MTKSSNTNRKQQTPSSRVTRFRSKLDQIDVTSNNLMKTNKPSFIKKNEIVFRIPNQYFRLNKAGIENAMKKFNLKHGNRKKDLWGNKSCSDNTKKMFIKHRNGLMYFCSILGDYESMLIIQDKILIPFVPSMKSETIQNFIKFKRGKKGSPLLDDQEICIKDVNGRPILCQGGWLDPKNVEQFATSVKTFHKSRNQRGPYERECDACLEQKTNENLGCDFHRPIPRLYRKGNPIECEEVENCMQKSSKDGSSYVAQGDSPLTPDELIGIRTKLVSSGNVWDFMIWVMILIGCKLFLREDEVGSIRFTDIVPELSIVKDDSFVESITLLVQGKTDKRPVNCTLWYDKEHPEFCPIRHLLIFMHIVGHSTGFLFPPFKDLKLVIDTESTSLTKGFETHIAYDVFLSKFQSLCKAVIPYRNGPFGTHSMRKTAYLLAVWGNGELTDIMNSARHKSIQQAKKYKQDAGYLLEIARQNKSSMLNLVPKWRPVVCTNSQIGRALNMPSIVNFKPLHILGDTFVINMLKIPVLHPTRSLSFMLKNAMSYRSVVSNPREALMNLIKQIAPEKSEEVLDLVERMKKTENWSSLCESNPRNNGNILISENKSDDQKKKQRGGSNNLDSRSRISKLKTGADKIKLLEELECEFKSSSELTGAARNFVITSLVPILKCYKEHCQSNLELFLKKWGNDNNFKHSDFKKKCCSGDADCKK